MANEIRVQSSLSVKKGSVDYQSRPTVFLSTLEGTGAGPTPGLVVVPLAGVNVDFSALSVPGLCRIMNLEAVGSGIYLEFSIWDASAALLPLGFEVLPGESYVVRLSRYLGDEIGTGTGSVPLGSGNALRLKAYGGVCRALVEAFER